MQRINRVEKALRHEEGDRVPKCELVIEKELVQEFTGNLNPGSREKIALLEHLNLDAVCLSPGEVDSAQEGYKDSGDSYPEELIEKYLDSPRTFSEFEEFNRATDFFVFALIDGSMGELIRFWGFENLMKALFREPQRVERMQRMLSQGHYQLAKNAIAKGAKGVIIGDDIAYQGGPFISPEMMQKKFFPFWKREAESIRNMGVPVLLHSEGNLFSLLPDLAAIYDGLHSLEPASHMSLKEVKKDYGGCLCLMGNLDLGYLYPGSKLEDLRSAVKKAMEEAKDGGGYIFGTCGGLWAGVSLEKVEAMSRFAEEYGKY